MFELTVIFIQDTSYDNKTTGQHVNRYRIWVQLPDKSGAWIQSNKPFAPGEKVKIQMFGSPYNDTMGQLMLKIV